MEVHADKAWKNKLSVSYTSGGICIILLQFVFPDQNKEARLNRSEK